MKYMIQDNQAGFVLKNGIFQKMITAGTYHFSKIAGYIRFFREILHFWRPPYTWRFRTAPLDFST